MGTRLIVLVLQVTFWISWRLVPVDLSPILPIKPADSNTVHHRNSGGASRSYASQMRPSPSDELPVPPLKYPDDDQSIPTEGDLDIQKLTRLLGRHFDPEFMSATRPLDSILSPNGTLVYDFKDGHPRGKMPEELRTLSLNIPDRRARIRIKSQRTRKKVRKFLWSFSYCPVLYTWKDLGRRFWPRWIREGDCYNQGQSCSIPAGMTCQQQGATTKTILWWHCRRKKCKWIKIQYPIITKCGCAC